VNCPEHLVFNGFGGNVYLWMYWHDVPRHMIPLRIWLNPLRYELFIRLPRRDRTRGDRIITINPRGHWARTLPAKLRRLIGVSP